MYLINTDPLMWVNIGEPTLPIQLASRGKSSIVPVGYDLVVGQAYLGETGPIGSLFGT